jgi:GxxExxY protein
MNTDYKYAELTHTIIGCAMRVYNILGNGFQEQIYQRAMAIEMAKHGLKFVEEFEMTIFYGNIKIGIRRVDFFVEEKVMVELKAIGMVENVNITQALNYLEASKTEIGLLLNFGSTSLQFHRLKLKEKFSHK